MNFPWMYYCKQCWPGSLKWRAKPHGTYACHFDSMVGRNFALTSIIILTLPPTLSSTSPLPLSTPSRKWNLHYATVFMTRRFARLYSTPRFFSLPFRFFLPIFTIAGQTGLCMSEIIRGEILMFYDHAEREIVI